MWIKKKDYIDLVAKKERNEAFNTTLLERQSRLLNENQELQNEVFKLKGLNAYEVRYNGEVSFSTSSDIHKGLTRAIIIHAKSYTCRNNNCYVFYDGEEVVAEYTDVLSIRKV